MKKKGNQYLRHLELMCFILH